MNEIALPRQRTINRTSQLAVLMAVLIVLLGTTLVSGGAGAQNPDREVAGFSIFVHEGRSDSYDRLWDVLPDRIQHIRADLGDSVLQHGEIHIVHNINEFFEQAGHPSRAPDWAQAVAVPARDLIVLRTPDPQPIHTMTHELSHLAVHDAVGGEHVPYWFLEGYAVLQAEEWTIERATTLSEATIFGNTLRFDSLDTQFPPHSLSAGVAYAQSCHFVRRLIADHGEAAVQNWLGKIRDGTPWRDAFREAFGIASGTAFVEWKNSIKVWYAWIPAIVSVTTLWVLVAGLAFWAFRKAKHRRKLQLALLGLEERQLYPHDPDDDLF